MVKHKRGKKTNKKLSSCAKIIQLVHLHILLCDKKANVKTK